MSFEQRDVQKLLKWCANNSTQVFSPKQPPVEAKEGGVPQSPKSPSTSNLFPDKDQQWVYTRPEGADCLSPHSPTSETFVHSPYTFFPYAVVSAGTNVASPQGMGPAGTPVAAK